MIKQTGRLIWWGLTASPLRTLFLLLTIIGSMSAFSTTEVALRDLANKANDVWRFFPYDLRVVGTNAFQQEPVILALPGVRAVERTYFCQVNVNSLPSEAAVPTQDGILLPIAYSLGRAPLKEDEIAISNSIATLGQIELGDRVEVFISPSSIGAGPGDILSGDVAIFTACGVVESKYYDVSCLTEGGLRRIHPSPDRVSTLLTTGDGAVDSANIKSAIMNLGKGLTVTIPEEEANNYGVLSMAMALTQTISLIMLLASVGGFYMLLTLSQKERAYDFGVLRAVGLSGLRLTLQLVLEGLVLIAIGGLLGAGLLYVVIRVMQLGNIESMVQQNLAPMRLLFIALLGATVWSARSIQQQSFTVMLRDER